MEVKTSKKSYYLPEPLMESFAEWCKPGRDYSPKIAAMVLAALALDDRALVDELSKLAHTTDIRTARKKARRLILDRILNAEIDREMSELDPGVRRQFLDLLKQAKEQASD